MKEFNDWETSNEDQASKGGKIEVDYPKVDADTVEDKLLNLQRALEHLRKARLLKTGLKTQLDPIGHVFPARLQLTCKDGAARSVHPV